VGVQPERLIADQLKPNSDRPAVIGEPITLSDGLLQREAKSLVTEEAPDEHGRSNGYRWWAHKGSNLGPAD
jgi:hypothetical protein